MRLIKSLCYLAITFIGMGVIAGHGDISSAVGAPKAEDIQKIFFAGDNFRNQMHISYPESLQIYASPEVVSWFKKINQTWWKDVPAGMVWRRLLLDSQLLITNIDSAPLLIYYSVWPDVYFITEWKMVEGQPKIIDADIVPGDWFRPSAKNEIHSAPYWSRSNMHLLDSIEASVALSLKQADMRYAENTDVGWRQLGGFANAEGIKRLKSSQAIARTNILSNLSNVFTFQTDENKKMGAMRSAVYHLLARLYLGEIKDYLFDKNLTIERDVEHYFGSVKERSLVDGNIVAHIEDETGASVFVVFPQTPHMALSIRLGKMQDRYRVEKIEIVNFVKAYLNAK